MIYTKFKKFLIKRNFHFNLCKKNLAIYAQKKRLKASFFRSGNSLKYRRLFYPKNSLRIPSLAIVKYVMVQRNLIGVYFLVLYSDGCDYSTYRVKYNCPIFLPFLFNLRDDFWVECIINISIPSKSVLLRI
jgi:hypothetical protein